MELTLKQVKMLVVGLLAFFAIFCVGARKFFSWYDARRLPNFTVETIKMEPTEARPGQVIKVVAQIKNTGR